MKKEEYYNRPRGCEHILLKIIAFVIIALSFLFSCEKNEPSLVPNCWKCETTYRWDYPDGDWMLLIKPDTIICSTDESFSIEAWEQCGSGVDTSQYLQWVKQCHQFHAVCP